MFKHSIKVPRIYKAAAKIAKEVTEGKGSIKELVYQRIHPNIKALYALVVHTIQHSNELENLFKKSKLLIKEPRFDPWLAKILITELLWGKGRLAGNSKPEQTIKAYEQILKAHLSDNANNYNSDEKLQQVEKPRYVRINTLKTSVHEAVDGFRDEGWTLSRNTDKKNYQAFLEKISNLDTNEFCPDIHVPNLLIFPPRTEFYNHPSYKNGQILLQDKASCLPIYFLNPEVGSVVLDMCAAPGMKTTQIASMLNNQGTVYAVELDQKRFITLNKIVESSEATCVKTINRDVLTLTEKECPGVEYILVDPSCSGSGITNRLDVGNEDSKPSEERLHKLAGFQIKILRYALTRFPKVKRVVYSTCSLYPEENEDVVRQVLETCTTFKLVSTKTLIDNVWNHFGSTEFGEMGERCLYARPEDDLTNGFFVAVFERLENNERNEFLNKELYKLGKKERKRAKKNVYSNEEQHTENFVECTDERKKQKKRKHSNDKAVDDGHNEMELGQDLVDNSTADYSVEKIKKKKKKKSKVECDDENNANETTSESAESVPKKTKKKKHKKHHSNEDLAVDDVEINENEEVKMKKAKKKNKNQSEIEGNDFNGTEPVKMKTKKCKKNKQDHDLED